MLRIFFGYVLTLIGLFVGFLAAVGWLISAEEIDRYLACFLGALAFILLVIGYRWTRRKRLSSWRDDPATDRQREFARDLGIEFPKTISKGELSNLISEVTGK